MNFIVEELYRFYFITTRYKRTWIFPLCFLLFGLVIKAWMISHYENYFELHSNDIFAQLVFHIEEKHLHKLNKIIIFGSLSIFFTAYLKYRKRY